MLLESPALLALGWLLGRWWQADASGFDEQGLLCTTALLCVSAFWMIPIALDLSLLYQDGKRPAIPP